MNTEAATGLYDVDAALVLMSKQADLLKTGIVTGEGNYRENPVEFRYDDFLPFQDICGDR